MTNDLYIQVFIYGVQRNK